MRADNDDVMKRRGKECHGRYQEIVSKDFDICIDAGICGPEWGNKDYRVLEKGI
jgi:hypothetical protein